MIAPRGTNIMELDRHASTAESPYGIITVDCSAPREIDDGVFVEALPTAQEVYRVGVCVADTSKVYGNGHIFKQAITNVEAHYWDLPHGERGYDPMLDTEIIRKLEFTEGEVRNALVISFLVGKKLPPSDLAISFGKVEVVENMSYRKFATKCKAGEREKQVGRAATLIIQHLKYNSGGDDDRTTAGDYELVNIYNRLINGPSREAWIRGSKLNEAFMVAANHLVGKALADEGRPAIYRVHNPDSERHQEFLSTNKAMYSWTPGRHTGLNLEPYCRVTSPLRRLEDFMMSYQLKQRYLGYSSTLHDAQNIAKATKRLNGYIVHKEFLRDPLRRTGEGLDEARMLLGNFACEGTNVVALYPNAADAEAV